MKEFAIISEEQILALGITPQKCVEWVETAFRRKGESLLSPKISQKPTSDSFFNTMPCCIPAFNKMGVKVVSRLPGNLPPLKSIVNLFDLTTGELLAVMDANWITAMRTGAVAALAAQTFASDFECASFGVVGLGSTACATMKCLIPLLNGRKVNVWLFEYKDQAERFAEKFSINGNVNFNIAHSRDELVRNTDVLFSCVTVMNEQFLPPESFPAGYTLIPVHTKGFQDCDMVFDHVFGDDKGHIQGFRHFNDFKTFAEISEVLLGNQPGRMTTKERILSYNVGIGLHDVWFASEIYNMITGE